MFPSQEEANSTRNDSAVKGLRVLQPRFLKTMRFHPENTGYLLFAFFPNTTSQGTLDDHFLMSEIKNGALNLVTHGLLRRVQL